MKLRPSRFSALLRHGGYMHLWEDDEQRLWLPWLGIEGTVWPAQPASGRVDVRDGAIVPPWELLNPRPAPTSILVEPACWTPESILCLIGAPQDAAAWRKSVGQQLTKMADVTIVERLFLSDVLQGQE